MNGSAPDQPGTGFRVFQPGAFGRGLRTVIYCLVVVALTGCSAFQGLTTARSTGPQETAIAAQLTILAATNSVFGAPQATQAAAVQATQPAVQQQPTYTPLATYTPEPTFTAQATYTPYPTFTPPPMTIPTIAEVSAPTQTPFVAAGRPYILRVYNNSRSTYWIGSKMPYGGNFIKPRYYVEFYPGQVAWMRVWYCRYTDYFYNHWNDNEWWNYEHNWKDRDQNWWDDHGNWMGNGNNGLYNCGSVDVYVDQPLVEVNVP